MAEDKTVRSIEVSHSNDGGLIRLIFHYDAGGSTEVWVPTYSVTSFLLQLGAEVGEAQAILSRAARSTAHQLSHEVKNVSTGYAEGGAMCLVVTLATGASLYLEADAVTRAQILRELAVLTKVERSKPAH